MDMYGKETPFGAFDSELMHQEISIPEGFTATIEGNKIILTKTESEDEKIRKELINYFNKGKEYLSLCSFDKKHILAWLEKQAEQKPTLRERYKNIAESEWFKKTHNGMSVSNDEEPKCTDDDEKIRKALIEYFNEQCDMSDWNGVYGYQVVAWLEKQKPIQNINKEDEEVRQYIIRIMEQRDINVPMVKKALVWLRKQGKHNVSAVWSEEDEKMFRSLHNLIYVVRDCDCDSMKKRELSDWLKSLKDKYTWKPSEDQIEALGIATDICSIPEKYYTELSKLYFDLKKLIE